MKCKYIKEHNNYDLTLQKTYDYVKFKGDDEWISEYMRWRGVVTHWMPIPEPPID